MKQLKPLSPSSKPSPKSKQHGIDPEEFLEDMGNHDIYAGADVLAWLGY
jgi:hypothetical protein